MYWPSGDHLGAKAPCKAVSREILPLWTSNASTKVCSSEVPLCPKTRVLPSGDQVGSDSAASSSLVTAVAEPPSLEMRNSFHGFPGLIPAKAICSPSGD